MKHVSLLAAAVAAALLPSTSIAEASGFIGTDQMSCYGESLELRLENGPQFILSIPFHVLTPTLFLRQELGSKPEKEQDAWLRACHPEPLVIASIYAANEQRPIPNLGLTDDGPLPSRFKITGGAPFDFERRHGRLARNFAEKFGTQVTKTGFIHYGDLPGGFYVAPDDYRDPQGGVFGFECIGGIECSTAYEVKCGAVLTYWFVANLRNYDLRYQNIPPENQWLELDRRMRRAVEPLIVCDPESTDQVGGKP